MTPNNHRWEKLADYFEQTMQDPRASKRIRMTAAQRLFELLERRNKQEASQARREQREAVVLAKRKEKVSGAKDSPIPEQPEDIRFQQMLEKIKAQKA